MEQNINFTFLNKKIEIFLKNNFDNSNSFRLIYEGMVVYGNVVVAKIPTNKNTNLTVYYKETPYVNPKTFHKKEYMKTDKEVRTSRQIDRSLRPFLTLLKGEITITVMLLQNLSSKDPLPCILWGTYVLMFYTGLGHLLKNIYTNLISNANSSVVFTVNDEGFIMGEGYFNKKSIAEVLTMGQQIQEEQRVFKEIYKQIIPCPLGLLSPPPLLAAPKSKTRLDGRKLKEIRKIHILLQPLEATSVIFSRGPTSVLTVMNIFTSDYNEFTLQYKFHPFSVGEPGETFGNSRREKGHSFLAQNSFKHLYHRYLSYKVVGEVLCCNGSSSMATVCGASLCLYLEYGEDFISGVTCGIINKKIIVDLSSEEDQISHCDIKVVSNRKKEILSIFMDTKQTISPPQLEELIINATNSNCQIIKKMDASVKNSGYRTLMTLKKEKMPYLLGKNNLQDLKNLFEVEVRTFDTGLIMLRSNNKKHFQLMKDILDSYNSLLQDKKITCFVKSKKNTSHEEVSVNLGVFNYITSNFPYEVGDLITATIENANNTSSKIILKNMKKINFK